MIKSKKYKIQLLLCFMLTVYSLLVLFSCTGTEQSSSENLSSSDNSDIETVIVDNKPDLPVVSYDGAALKILYYEPNTTYGERYLEAKEMDGEVINDAIFTRNADIEDKYDIFFDMTESNTPDTASKKIIMAGDPLDLIWMSMTGCASLAMQNYLYNLADAPYFNFSKSYWDFNSIEQLSIHGIAYMAVNDISPSMLSGARFIFFNKYLIEQYSLENPYTLVDTNKWTIDNYFNMVRSVSADLNGDSIMDHNDRYGMLTEDCNLRFLLHGFGVRLTGNNADGELELTFMNDFTVTAFEKLRTILLDKTITLNYNDISKTADITGFDHVFAYARGALFASDHFLFLQNGANIIDESLRTMEHDFGIVPNPKYDSSQ